MGNTHNKQRIQFFHEEQQQHHKETNMVVSSSRSLLPILCSRNSTNDIIAQQPSFNITTDEEPLSPKLGCMGQLKNNKRTNRVYNNNTTTKHQLVSSNAAITVAFNNSKLRKKLFSCKNILLSSATTSTSMKTTAAIRSKSWVGPRSSITINNPTRHQFNFIREMDPPLPVVVNKPLQEGGLAESRSSVLWKRRFGDVSSLETLDLNQLNTIHSTPPPQPLSV